MEEVTEYHEDHHRLVADPTDPTWRRYRSSRTNRAPSTGTIRLAISAWLALFPSPRLPMLLALTRQEKRIIAVLALLIVLGLVGLAVL